MMTSHRASPEPEPAAQEGTGRRKFLGYLLAAPTLIAASRLVGDVVNPPKAAAAGVPSNPLVADYYDLSDALTDATRPTANLITVEVRDDGTIHHASPVSENGQGITTALAMVIAEEMSAPLSSVKVTLADARPELLFNQLTGGSNNLHAKSEPLRVAAAIAREQLMLTAANRWGVSRDELTVEDGVVRHSDGRSADFASLATAAAATATTAVETPPLKPRQQWTLIGTKQNRIDALEMVTGRKVYAGDLNVPGALPTMVHRGPNIRATVESVENMDDVAAMPGITDVGVITNGVAVRARTFGQCIDAVRALKVSWHDGPLANESDETVLRQLKDATIPMPPPTPGAKVLEFDFVNYFSSNTPLETGFAVADVREGSAEIWYASKIPIIAQQEIAQRLGMTDNAVTFHVMHGGGSFGRRLFHDPAMDAAEASQLFRKPVRLMWHRSDDFRHGRAHPMAVSRVRATYLGDQVLSYHQHHTSVETDYGHGLGEIITGTVAKQDLGNLSVAQGVYALTAKTFYNFGVTETLLNEIPLPFWTGSMRNVYSPNVRCAHELMVDQLAKAMGKDPLEFRLAYAQAEYRPLLERVAQLGDWGRTLPTGVAQGIAIADEYKHRIATLVEIDTRPETVNRKPVPTPEEGYVTGPRVTKATVVVQSAHVYDPNGFEGQLLGGTNDGIAIALTFSNHIKDGLPLEGSWDQGYYTRQWNTPREINIHFLPNTYEDNRTPGGAGELAVAPAMAAVACAYGRATGSMPTEFPINHNNELPFHPFPTQPPVPQSHTNGLDHAY